MQVLGGSVDGSIRQFDIRMGMMFTDTLHEAVTGIAVSHDGNCVLASCLDNSLKLLDKASGESLATYTGKLYMPYANLPIPVHAFCPHLYLLHHMYAVPRRGPL